MHSTLRGTETGTDTPRDARDAATRVLVRHARSFPDLLPIEPDTSALSDRDAALAHTILNEAVGRWITLAVVIAHAANRSFKELEPEVQGVLLSGAAQLVLLDKIPPHAAIDESVQWVKSHHKPKAAGLVNAILRNVDRVVTRDRTDQPIDGAVPLGDGSYRVVRRLSWPSDDAEQLGAMYSLPSATVRRWFTQHPDDAFTLVTHSIVRPPTVLLDPEETLSIDAGSTAPHEAPHARVYTGERGELGAFLESNLGVRVQDAASASVVSQIPESDPGVVVDLCAGQGTKTKQLLERFPDAMIHACEVDEKRLGTLASLFEHEDRVTVSHAENIGDRIGATADLVACDVPCSNSGVLARRVEARYRGMTTQLERLTAIQREIVTNAAGLLADGGTLVYSTCSIEREENEDQRDWMNETLGLTAVSDHALLPKGGPGDPSSVYRDGAYCAVSRKGVERAALGRTDQQEHRKT